MKLNPLWFPKKPTWPSTLGRLRVKRLQRRLNYFFSEYLDGIPPLTVDGKMGHLTQKRIRLAKGYIGRTGHKDTRVNRQFMKRLRHPNDPKLVVGSRRPAAVVKRGQQNRKTHDRLFHESQFQYDGRPHWVMYDGKMIAAYLEPINNWARHTGHNGLKWRGVVVSGGRTAAYSQHLCEMMCGAPTCPGRCAGIHTNHVGNDPHRVPSGAEDVSDYERFGYLMQFCPFKELGTVPIHNALPNDRVHFSPSGR